MAKKAFFLILLFLVNILLFISVIDAVCISSSDNYAVEVLLNKPGIGENLKLLEKADNVILDKNSSIIKSRYNESIAVILSDVSNNLCKKCLDVKLQVPTQSIKEEMPYLTVLLNSLKGQLKLSSGISFYKDWKIVCNFDNKEHCQFKKDKIEVIIDKVVGKYQAIVELNENFHSCSGCQGRCLHNSRDNFCVGMDIEQELKEIFKFSGITYDSDNIFYSYTILDKGLRNVYEIQPLANISASWPDVLKTDLLWLRRIGVIFISNADIEKVSSLSQLGNAGDNFKIIYGQNTDGVRDWFYEYETEAAYLETENCEAFPISRLPIDYVSFPEAGLSIYYTIPLFVSLFILGILLILIVIGRISTIKKEEKVLA